MWDVYIQHHPEAAKHRTKTLVFYEVLREIFKCATGQFATSSSLDDPATPAVTSSSFSRVSTLKRSNTCLDLIDEDECQTDRPSERGGSLPCIEYLQPDLLVVRRHPVSPPGLLSFQHQRGRHTQYVHK